MIPNNTKSGIISIIRFSGEKKHSTFSAASFYAFWLSTRHKAALDLSLREAEFVQEQGGGISGGQAPERNRRSPVPFGCYAREKSRNKAKNTEQGHTT